MQGLYPGCELWYVLRPYPAQITFLSFKYYASVKERIRNLAKRLHLMKDEGKGTEKRGPKLSEVEGLIRERVRYHGVLVETK